MTIQHMLEDEEPSADGTGYESIECPACLEQHFIDRSTGELVPENGTGETSPPIAPVT